MSQIAGQCQQPSKHTLTCVHCATRRSLCQSRISPSTEKPEEEHRPRSRTSGPVLPRPAASVAHVFRQLPNAGRYQLPTQNRPAEGGRYTERQRGFLHSAKQGTIALRVVV